MDVQPLLFALYQFYGCSTLVLNPSKVPATYSCWVSVGVSQLNIGLEEKKNIQINFSS